jgi:hypothetical protein
MIKNTIVALVAAASLGGLAVPAMAATSISTSAPSSESNAFDADFQLVRLHDKGINATSVETWGPLVRAFVTLEDGTQAMQFFTPDTLTPVSL